jgi:hypothetical protein
MSSEVQKTIPSFEGREDMVVKYAVRLMVQGYEVMARL